jgi:hypothetical protein
MAAWIGSVKLPRDRGMLRRAAQAAQATRRLDACKYHWWVYCGGG